MIRSILKFLVFCFAVVIILIIFLPSILSLHPVQKFVLNAVGKKIDKTIEIENLQIGWFHGISMKEVTISDKDKNFTISLPYVHADYSLTHRMLLSELIIKNGTLTLQDTSLIKLDKLLVEISLQKDDTLLCNVKGNVLSGNQKGSLNIDCIFKNFDYISAKFQKLLDSKVLTVNIRRFFSSKN